jgi:hypothetical protein
MIVSKIRKKIEKQKFPNPIPFLGRRVSLRQRQRLTRWHLDLSWRPKTPMTHNLMIAVGLG